MDKQGIRLALIGSAVRTMTEQQDAKTITGQCLCGRIRYRTTAAPNWVAYCHCRSCRRATGSVVAAYAGYPRSALVFEGDQPAIFESSPEVRRSFCSHCGTPLTYASTRWPEEVHLLLGSADSVDELKPSGHVYTSHRIAWFDTADDLPRFPTFPPD